jgi:hypothetical protein
MTMSTHSELQSLFDRQLQEVRGTTDARVVVADHVFAFARGGFVIQAADLWHVMTQVVFDLPLIL